MRLPVLSLVGSLRVALVDAYGDGTVWFTIEDSGGRRATLCIDGREGSSTRHRLFDLARHPGKPGAVLLELGGPEEGLVVPLVSRWLDSAGPRELGLTEFGWEIVRDALLRLGAPIAAGES
jgi:hypothetical protein